MNNKLISLKFYKISFSNFRKNIYSHILSILIIILIISTLFFTNVLYFSWKQIIDSINSENSIIIKNEIKWASDVLNIKTVQKIESALSKIPTIETSYNFFLKIPTSVNINYIWLIKFTTDIFFIAYDFNVLKKWNYTKINEHNEDKIWIILPSRALFLLNNTVFNTLSKENIGFLWWEIFFWKSTVTELSNMQSEFFYIEWMSDDLPIYAAAIDYNIAFKILENFNINKQLVKVYEMKINYKNTEDFNKIQESIKIVENSNQSKFLIKNIWEDNEQLKNKYYTIISIVWSVFAFLIMGMILYIFYLKSLLLIEKNKKTTTTLRYLGLSDFFITNIYFLEYKIVLFLSLIIFLTIGYSFDNIINKYISSKISILVWISNFSYEPHYEILIIEYIIIIALIYLMILRKISFREK